MATDLQTIVVGDTMTPIDMTITDANNAAVDLTSHEVRLFVRGAETGDLPETSGPLSISALTYTTSAKTITRASGSFVSDGVLVGMLVIGTGIPEGTVVKTVSALTLTIDNTPTIAGSSVAVRFWNGILCVITDAAAGAARAQAVGGMLNLGGARSDTYRGRARAKNTVNGEVGWTNDSIAVVEFKAVTP
jgi:hypothetical protein